jgi:ubiquinone biosynthesis protein
LQIVRPLVSTFDQLHLAARNLSRLREVAAILVRHGLGPLVRGVPEVDADGGPSPASSGLSLPQRLVRAVEELGPTYVKAGQVLSTRPDLLPAEMIAALQTLQDAVKAVPWEGMVGVLRDELGPSWEELFARFETEPLGTASIAQVYTATLMDGTEVVLKVQRPGIATQIDADLNILRFLAHRALVEYPEVKAMDPLSLLAEFERTLRSELDFRREAENMARFGLNFAETPGVVVPSPVDLLVTQRVLGMTRLFGVPIRKARDAGHDMEVVGRRYLDTVFDMLLVHGFFHGDLHPGNVLVLPGDRIGILDFGMVGTVTERMRNELVTMMFALRRGEHRTIARVIYDIAVKDERLDYRRVEAATIEVVEKHFPPGAALRDIEMGAFALELVTRAVSFGCRIPTGYMMVLKALITMEGLAKTLLQEVDPIQHAEPYFASVVGKRLAPDRLQQEALYALLTLGSLVDRLPISLAQLLDDLDGQRLHLGLRHQSDPVALAQRERLVNRAAVAAFACAALIAASLASTPTQALGLAALSGGAALLFAAMARRSSTLSE